MQTIRLVLAHRSAGVFHSIEELFGSVARAFPPWVCCREGRAPSGRARPTGILANLRWMVALGKGDVDVIHQTGDIHYAVLGIRRCPTILTIHDLRFFDESRGLKRWLFRWLWLELPCRHARRVTVISEFTKRRLLEVCRVHPDKVRVIPNCVSEDFRYAPKARPERPRVLLCGTTPNKNWERVLEAGADFKVQWVMLGRLDGQQKEWLSQRGWAMEEHHGLSREEVVQLYQSCDLLCFVSTYEGFGMPILEAQAMGRPVLTSNLSPMDEVAGDGALKVDPYDVTSIRKGLERLLREPDLRADLVEAGFANVSQYSAKAIAAQYAELYREVLSKR